jgi:hypothetical protein
MSPREDRIWAWLRRAVGLGLLIYVVVVNPPGLPSWVALLIAGAIGLPDVALAQIGLNRKTKDEGES